METKIISYYEKPAKKNLNYSPEENGEKEKENQKNSTKSHHSSDLTSFSYTPTEAFSQISENSYYPNDLNTHQNLNGINGKLNYFADVITYFKKTEPAKFYEYKDSKNFVPKRKKEKIENINNQYNNNINIFNNSNNNNEENKIVPVYYIPVDSNTYNNMINGNIIYYVYNNFYFNFSVNNNQIEKDLNKTEKKEKIQDNKTSEKENNKIKEEKKDEKIEIKKRNDIEIIKAEKNKGKIEDNYYMKKRNKKNSNKSPIRKNEDKEIEYYESNRHRNKKDFHFYEDPYEIKTYSNNYKGKYRQYDQYNKFNSNLGGRKRKFYDENKFYKRRYNQPMYY